MLDPPKTPSEFAPFRFCIFIFHKLYSSLFSSLWLLLSFKNINFPYLRYMSVPSSVNSNSFTPFILILQIHKHWLAKFKILSTQLCKLQFSKHFYAFYSSIKAFNYFYMIFGIFTNNNYKDNCRS